MSDIALNIKNIQQRIAMAATHAGRDPNEITLVAVSKTFPADAVLEAYQLGMRHFGENRVEEATEKIPSVTRGLGNYPTTEQPNITWHLIGHLQSRKAKDAVALFDSIQSIDSVALAIKLNNHATVLGKKLAVLIEVNVSGEESKYGFAPQPRQVFISAAREIIALPQLDLQGLMTIAPIAENADDPRPRATFRALRELRDALAAEFPLQNFKHLSMGMTDDFETAIAEGATIIRVGRAIFGKRKSPGEV